MAHADRLPRVLATHPGPAQGALAASLQDLADRRAVARLWAREPALWKPDPAEQQELADRLGWLDLPQGMRAHLQDLRAFADEVRAEGVRHVVLCGMGGSSLAPEVFRLTFNAAEGFPRLLVLDSTDPGAVRAVDDAIDPQRTLFLISSKSGGTIEVMAFLAHFWGRVVSCQLSVVSPGDAASGPATVGQRFCAITDPGTSLERLARERGFRRVFQNPPDIGGRYSALSLFGLVPAALSGVDVARLLERASVEADLSTVEAPEANPGAWLAAYMGGCAARLGRDKLTLLTSPALASFGLWVEQLIAESTGKQGTGIVPIVGEAPGRPEVYGQDRCFVAVRLDGDDNGALDAATTALRDAGQPVVVHQLADRYDLGAEMYRWEVATALAGVLLGINPFDQPNVQESKDNTARVLRELHTSGQLPSPPLDALIEDDGAGLASFLAQTRTGDYVAIQAYLTPTAEVERLLQALRTRVRDELKVATTLGFGPRFLHSTGQLHKGGPPSGVFFQLTYQPGEPLPVPGQPYSFGELIAAQALGDLQSLRSRDLRAARADLGSNVEDALRQLERAVAAMPTGF